MSAWIYDGTFDGLLTAISLLHESGERPEALSPVEQTQLGLFAAPVSVTSDSARAGELLKALRERATAGVVRAVAFVGLSELPDLEMALFDFVELAFRHGGGVLGYHANPAVRRVTETARKVGAEIHRLKGLLRFRDTEEGLLWGPLEPDHNVIVPVALHFRRRMPRERWMVHDVRRELAVLWNGKELEELEGAAIPAVRPTESEGEVQELWRTFYEKVSIAERRNPRLQRQHMPRRYWTYLVEKGGNSPVPTDLGPA